MAGCRCDACRSANTRAYHNRKAKAREACADLPTPADGICPGIEGKSCPRKTKLRSDSASVCARCLDQSVFNGLVSATPARRHLQRLSRQGVGYKTVSDASDVGKTTMLQIVTGERKRIRKNTAEAILGVSVEASADHGLVPAARTWAMLEHLEPEYLGTEGLAQALGYRSGKIQIRKTRVLARTEHRVIQLYRRTFGEDVRLPNSRVRGAEHG